LNWFKLYMGDYQRDTAALSLVEHGAYLMMLQLFYATEKPIPTGKALYRMLRAQDKEERDAIDAVINQFWTETPNGLVNARANIEIAKASNQADTNARIAREREGKRKVSRDGNETSTNRATNSQPNQTTRLPDTRHQTPDIKTSAAAMHSIEPEDNPESAAADDAINSRANELVALFRKHDVHIYPTDLNVHKWAERGITDEQALGALTTAKQRRADADSDQPIGACYLNTFINDPNGPAWWSSSNAMLAKAAELGIAEARPGETMNDFRNRIKTKLAEARA
jgi:uncharacterized protein YdaU (DUF1376 family)